MVERIVETPADGTGTSGMGTTPGMAAAPASTHTTVIERSGGSGAGWAIALILLLAVLVGGYFLLQRNNREAARTDAVTSAAKSVGSAADKAGDAIENVVK